MKLSNLLSSETGCQAVQYLQQFIETPVHTSIIFGSFLNKTISFLPLNKKVEIDMKDLPSYPLPSVEGHRKIITSGNIGSNPVLLFGGRIHYYEGYALSEIVLPVIISRSLGAKQIIITNSAGGLNPDFHHDDLMLIQNHINLMGTNPLFGYGYDPDHDYFIDLAQPYSQDLLSIAECQARNAGLTVRKGVYAGVKGPVLETAAETDMLKIIGADAVGMSTVAETIMANYLDLDVLGISHIRNLISSSVHPFRHMDGNKKETKVGKMLSILIEKVIENS